MPAVNTPQFSWGPVTTPPPPPAWSPDFSTRVAARLSSTRRSTPSGSSTGSAQARWALASPRSSPPRLLDRYLARTLGFDSQQTDEDSPEHADNLDVPADGAGGENDYGAHGTF